MTLDDILLEWSYRLPKGYPTVVDGQFVDQKELQILQEVMGEYGYKEPLNLEAKEEAAPQSISMTKEQLIAALSDPKVDISPKTIAKINSLIKRNARFEESITVAIKESLKGDSSHADEILDIILADDTDQMKLHTYLQNPTVSIDVFMNNPVKLTDAFRDTGISASTLGDLALYRWSATPQLGTLEVMLAVLLKGGARPAKSGDLMVEGQPFEVGGFNKRLRSQKGLGSSGEAQAGFKRGYAELARKKNLIVKGVSLSGGARPMGDGGRGIFNLIEDDARYGSDWNKGWMSAIEEMNKQLIEQTSEDSEPVTTEELIAAMAEGFGSALSNRKSANDWMWIARYLKKDGSLDRKNFLAEFAGQYLDYYMSMEADAGKMFIVTDASVSSEAPSKENFSALVFPATSAGLIPHIFTNIGLTIPSYREKAGIQGVAFALKLGRVSGLVSEDLDDYL